MADHLRKAADAIAVGETYLVTYKGEVVGRVARLAHDSGVGPCAYYYGEKAEIGGYSSGKKAILEIAGEYFLSKGSVGGKEGYEAFKNALEFTKCAPMQKITVEFFSTDQDAVKIQEAITEVMERRKVRSVVGWESATGESGYAFAHQPGYSIEGMEL